MRAQPGRQWRPDGVAPNCCLPRVLRLVQDYFSPAQWLVILAITTNGPKELCTRNSDGTWRVKGMSYAMIAARAGVCWKTARNAIKRAIALKLIRDYEAIRRGGRRVKTHYVIESFTAFLAAKRADPALFHTADGHLVGIGRNPRLMDATGAGVWKINPNAPPAPRSAGPVSSSRDGNRYQPHAMDLEHVMDALRRANCTAADRANATKACEVSQRAWSEAGQPGEMPGDTMAAFISQIGHEYKPSTHYPKPTLGWFVKFIPLKIKAWARMQTRTG